ncbi:unnamed protein product [Alopecurus aequalis]
MENIDLSRAKRFLRWTWLRLSTRRFLARNNAEVAASPRVGLAAMLEDDDGADVTFIVGDREFRAYRRVLAAVSPVFAAELFGPMQETSARHVKIDDMEPAVFEALLHFACTGALPEDVDGVAPLQHLLVAADRYGMQGLMAACEWRLCRSIDVENVATTLALAELHQRVKLKDACIRFVSTKSVMCAVRETEGFAHLVETCPLVMVDMLEHKLPSRVTRILTLCGTGLALCGTSAVRGLTGVRRGLTRFGTDAYSFSQRDDVQAVGIGVAFISAFGFGVFMLKNFEASLRELDSLLERSLDELQYWIARHESPAFSMVGSLGRRDLSSWLHKVSSISSLGRLQDWVGRQDLSSWIPKVSPSSLGRLQEFQESAWLNSDI